MKRDFHAPARSPVFGTSAMVATSMPIATLAAIDVLRAGGNAMDAAIAACATLCVVEPQMTGLGGDCFCLYAPAGSGRVIALNGSGKAPAAATLDALRAAGVTELTETMPHAVTVPGAVSAWETLHRAHGRAEWGSLFQRAIACAEDGWPIAPRVHLDWSSARDKLARNEAAARHLLVNGAAPAIGSLFAQPALGRTLRAIAARGAPAFYEGEIAADIVATLRELGGLHTEEDFVAGLTSAEFVTPISRVWNGMEIFQCPPNGSGLHVLMLLGILEGFDHLGDPLSPTRLHRHVEAARLVYRDRDAFLADPSQADVPVAHLTSPAYLDTLRALIDDRRAMPELPPAGMADWLPRHKDTVYLCVVDKDGNACSFINSLFKNFGSGILAEKSGVLLQNRGFGFRLERGHPNCIAPRKGPLHTIMPGMAMRDGRPLMPFGVMGGHFQPMGQSWFLGNHVDYGLDIQESLDLPRLFPYGGKVEVERGIPAKVVAELARLGHDIVTIDKPHGGGQAILIDHARGCLIGASDPRKDGCAMGY